MIETTDNKTRIFGMNMKKPTQLSSSDDSIEDKLSPDKLSSNEQDLEKEEDKGRDNTFESLGMTILSSSI